MTATHDPTDITTNTINNDQRSNSSPATHPDPPSDTTSALPGRRRRLKRWVLLAGLVVLVGGIWVFSNRSAINDTAAVPVSGPVNLAEAAITDLVQQVSFDGTVGRLAAEPITAAGTGTVTVLGSAGSTIGEADVLYQIDDKPVALLLGATPAYRDITLGTDTIEVAPGTSGVITRVVPAGTVIELGDPLYWIDEQPVNALFGTVPAYRTMRDEATNQVGFDIAQLKTGLAALGFDLGGTLTIDSEFSFATGQAVADWQESIGREADGAIDAADIVFLPGNSQIVELAAQVGDTVAPGDLVMTLSTGDAMIGADVAQLETALAALGYDAGGTLLPDDVYDATTAAAIAEFQTAIGQTPDGVVNLGEIVFTSEPLRITKALVSVGSTVSVGDPILAVAAAEQVVRMQIPAGEQELVEVGDAVTVILPGFDEALATVVSIDPTATVDANGEVVFDATIALDNPDVAEDLNEAPVTIDVVGDTATGVLAVPVTALIALNEGGYAVEVQTATGFQLVAVDPGFFADGLVAITTDGVSAGDMVTLP